MGEKMTLATELRRVCGHDSRSVDGCLHCEAADALEATHLTQPAQAVDVGAIREVIAELSCTSHQSLQGAADFCGEQADKLTAAIPNANGKEG